MGLSPALTAGSTDNVRSLTEHTNLGQPIGWTWAQRTGLLRRERWFAVLPDQSYRSGPLSTYTDAVNVLNGAAGLPAELGFSGW